MATTRTLEGNLAITCVKREYELGNWGNVASYSNYYLGRSGDVNDFTEYAIRLAPGVGDVFAYSNADNIVSASIKLKVRKKTTTDGTSAINFKRGLKVDCLNATEPINIWSQIKIWSGYYTTVSTGVPKNSTEERPAEIQMGTPSTGYTQFISYGYALEYTGFDVIEITEAVLSIEVQDEFVLPEISFLAENGAMVDGVYHHDPNKDFKVSVSYSQATGGSINRLNVSATGFDGKDSWIGELADTYLYIAAQYWAKLPVSGTLSIQANNGYVYSETLTIPYVVDEYDVHFTSPTSGSVIQSDSDVTISWEAVAPSTQTIDAPNKYLTEIWFDNGEGSGGDYTTLTSKTISADQLAGHSQLHMRLYSYYALCEDSKENAPVMNLYIQQVAGTGNVTVNGATTKAYIVSVSWESTGQTAYQVRVGSYTSEIVWGNDTQYYVPFVLETGVMYSVQVRIQSTQGEWTDWTEPVYVTPQNLLFESKEGIRVTVEDGFSTVEIAPQIDNLTNYTTVLLYRDGVPIATFDVAEKISYTDVGANGETTYSVAYARFFSTQKQGLAGFLAPVTIDATPSTDGLVLSDKTWLPLRYTTDEIKYGGSASEEVYQRYYSGRSYPVVMRSGRKTETLTLSYADPTGELADTLIEQVGTTVLFKNRDGLKFWGCLESVTPTRHLGWCEVSLTLRKVDVNEWVPLIWGEKT